MSMTWVYGTHGNEPRARATIRRAVDVHAESGVPALIDTSDAYGPFLNEELVGRAR